MDRIIAFFQPHPVLNDLFDRHFSRTDRDAPRRVVHIRHIVRIGIRHRRPGGRRRNLTGIRVRQLIALLRQRLLVLRLHVPGASGR